MKATLTRRGQLLVGAGLLFVLAAWLFGLRELYGLGAAAIVLAVGARLWVDVRRFDLEVARVVHPPRVPAGQEARVELSVRNPGRLPSPAVEARDPFDGGKRWARFAIAAVGPGDSRTGSYRLPSTRRGVYHLGPLELVLADPLGLASRARRTAADTTFTVHPAWEPVPVRPASSHRDEDRRNPRPLMGKGGSDLYALREYVPGDDLRHVHWPSTARLGDLVIRQPENLRRGRLTVAADLRAEVHDATTLEALLSAVASVAMSALDAGLSTRVVTSGGWDSGSGEGAGHGPAVLDGLAAAAAHPGRAGVSPFRLAGRSDPVVVVTTDRASARDLRSAVTLGGVGGTTVVAFETAGPGTRPRSGMRTVRVAPGASFADAWRRWEMAAC